QNDAVPGSNPHHLCPCGPKRYQDVRKARQTIPSDPLLSAASHAEASNNLAISCEDRPSAWGLFPVRVRPGGGRGDLGVLLEHISGKPLPARCVEVIGILELRVVG